MISKQNNISIIILTHFTTPNFFFLKKWRMWQSANPYYLYRDESECKLVPLGSGPAADPSCRPPRATRIFRFSPLFASDAQSDYTTLLSSAILQSQKKKNFRKKKFASRTEGSTWWWRILPPPPPRLPPDANSLTSRAISPCSPCSTFFFDGLRGSVDEIHPCLFCFVIEHTYDRSSVRSHACTHTRRPPLPIYISLRG